jgi:integrase
MARTLHRLNALAVSRAKHRGYLADGGGLYLQVSATGSKSWVFRFREGGRLREMGLGPAHTVTLVAARQKATECRTLRLEGLDPIAERQAGKLKARLEAAGAMTFRQCAEAYINAHRRSWNNKKHAAQWPSTLEAYAYPAFGDQPVHTIDTPAVLRAIEPVWHTRTETASRLRQRIEAILDWATTRGHRRGENPARWRGHLEHTLPARTKVQKVRHHPALPYREMTTFMTALRAQKGLAASALEFLILTAARSGEVLNATWNEIDLSGRVWTIPADRMKGGKEHRVPLSESALAIFKRFDTGRTGRFVFPNKKPDKPLSGRSMFTQLERMGHSFTVHGFRSTFRDWAAEQTNFPRDVVEQALAHSLRDKVEAAYRRGDLFEKRRKLMDAWAGFCQQSVPEGKVMNFRPG